MENEITITLPYWVYYWLCSMAFIWVLGQLAALVADYYAKRLREMKGGGKG